MGPGRPCILKAAEPACIPCVPAVPAVGQQLQGPRRVQVRLDHHILGQEVLRAFDSSPGWTGHLGRDHGGEHFDVLIAAAVDLMHRRSLFSPKCLGTDSALQTPSLERR